MTDKLYIHYALQTCDTAHRQINGTQRYVPATRSDITKKCVTSFLESVTHAANIETNSVHVVRIFDDHSITETVNFLKLACIQYTKNNVIVELEELTTHGLIDSVRSCYEFLRDNGKHIVYQVQDDYLFTKSAIYEMIDVFLQVKHDTNSEPIVLSFNHPFFWQEIYRYKPIPRVVVPGHARYWIQLYEAPCTFLTGLQQFKQHWDLYEKFFYLLEKDPEDPAIEIDTFNQIHKRNVLLLTPMTSVALHLQSVSDIDPYVDWKPIWDSIKDII